MTVSVRNVFSAAMGRNLCCCLGSLLLPEWCCSCCISSLPSFPFLRTVLNKLHLSFQNTELIIFVEKILKTPPHFTAFHSRLFLLYLHHIRSVIVTSLWSLQLLVCLRSSLYAKKGTQPKLLVLFFFCVNMKQGNGIVTALQCEPIFSILFYPEAMTFLLPASLKGSTTTSCLCLLVYGLYVAQSSARNLMPFYCLVLHSACDVLIIRVWQSTYFLS